MSSSSVDLHKMFDIPVEQELDEHQRQAVNLCTSPHRLVAVTGSAGTGKTIILKTIHRLLVEAGFVVGVGAPTGKAAKRILEATGIQAMTYHKMLGYGQPIESKEEDSQGNKKTVRLSTGPRFSRGRPMPYDIVLADEYAMVNNEIHNNLTAAMKPGSRLRVFGDVNQLKPIEEDKRAEGEPTPFERILANFPKVVLQRVFRQEEGSAIADNCVEVLAGKTPKKREGFDIIYTDEPVRRLVEFINTNRTLGDAGLQFDQLSAQIITPMNKTWVGTKRLNATIQHVYWNPERRSMELPRHRWAEDDNIRVQVGSKVVYTVNTYDLGNGHYALNGEVGIVEELDENEGHVTIDFGDRVVVIPPLTIIQDVRGHTREFDPRKNIDLAYVLTTHRMQGSEVLHVTYVLNKSTSYAQSRRNLYTAITRARRSVQIVTDQQSMLKSVKAGG